MQDNARENKRNIVRRVKDSLSYHLVDSTALLAESTPIFAAFETGIAGMSDDISINARLIAAGLAYAGVGTALAKGRDLWRKVFKVSDTTKERVQMLHDTAYLAAFNLVTAPAIYYASGSRDLEEITIGTSLGIAFGSANGSPLGYAIDTFRDLTGLKECERPSYPNLLKRQSSKIKKLIATGLVAGTLGVTAGIYGLTHDEEPTSYNSPQSIEQTIQENK